VDMGERKLKKKSKSKRSKSPKKSKSPTKHVGFAQDQSFSMDYATIASLPDFPEIESFSPSAARLNRSICRTLTVFSGCHTGEEEDMMSPFQDVQATLERAEALDLSVEKLEFDRGQREKHIFQEDLRRRDMEAQLDKDWKNFQDTKQKWRNEMEAEQYRRDLRESEKRLETTRRRARARAEELERQKEKKLWELWGKIQPHCGWNESSPTKKKCSESPSPEKGQRKLVAGCVTMFGIHSPGRTSARGSQNSVPANLDEKLAKLRATYARWPPIDRPDSRASSCASSSMDSATYQSATHQSHHQHPRSRSTSIFTSPPAAAAPAHVASARSKSSSSTTRTSRTPHSGSSSDED